MLQLILKDFRANWLYQLFSLAFLFCISTLFTYCMLEEEGAVDPVLVFYFVIVLVSSSVVSLLFMILDNVHKTDRFYLSLPITRTQFIKAKYSSSILQALLALAAHFIGTQFGIYLEGSIAYPGLEIIYKPILWITLFSLLLVFKSYAYLIYFKFGLDKGIIIHSIIQFLLFVSFITIMINYSKMWNYFQDGIAWVFNQNKIVVLTICIVSILLIVGASITVSTKIFKNEDI